MRTDAADAQDEPAARSEPVRRAQAIELRGRMARAELLADRIRHDPDRVRTEAKIFTHRRPSRIRDRDDLRGLPDGPFHFQLPEEPVAPVRKDQMRMALGNRVVHRDHGSQAGGHGETRVHGREIEEVEIAAAA